MGDDDANLMRSERQMNFDEREIDEYVSTESDHEDSSQEEESNNIIEESSKKKKKINQHFRPGKNNDGLLYNALSK